ncbi:melatonin receptor type 1B-B-like [Convolutriloba macropyga]|uniref:melatonin receptor type 1B-B-like n=1 Tax=Convolutriloba macropyga TaxID=536237 RepID=UPI003F51CDCF
MANITAQLTELDFIDDWVQPLHELTMDRSKKLRIVMITWLLISLLLGIPGNFLVMASVIFTKHLRELHHVFIVVLAVFDLGVMTMNVFVLLGTIYGDTFLPNNPILCEVSGIICMVGCVGSIWAMMFIAINRFVFVCKNDLYSTMFSKQGTVLSIVCLVICVLLIDLPNMKILGLGSHPFNKLYLRCFIDVNKFFNTILVTGGAIVFPVCVITFCYYNIWKLASKSSSIASGSKKREKEQKQLLICLVTIFIAFVITWAPYGVYLLLQAIKYEMPDLLAFG